LFAIVWELFLRKQDFRPTDTNKAQQDKWKDKRGISGILLLLVLFLLLLEVIVCAQVAIDSGFNLQENVLFTGGAGVRDVKLDVETLNNDIYFLQAVAISHSAVIGLFTTLFAVAGTLAEGKYFGLGLWLAAIFAAILIGLSRFAHLPPDSYVPVNRGLRDFCIALTVITDGALAAYAFFVACSRYRVQSVEETIEDEIEDAKKKAIGSAPPPVASPPRSIDKQLQAAAASRLGNDWDQDDYMRLRQGGEELAPFLSSRLPLLALRPQP